jgi:diaminopimelate decarboxylase
MDAMFARWGLSRRLGRLQLDGIDLVHLAKQYGTPLHVVSRDLVASAARGLQQAFADYPGGTRICFSYKTNKLVGVLHTLHGQGIDAEVVDGFELWLSQKLGVPAERVVFNGPNKSDEELSAAVESGVGLVVVDNLPELERLARYAAHAPLPVGIALF